MENENDEVVPAGEWKRSAMTSAKRVKELADEAQVSDPGELLLKYSAPDL